MQNVFVEITKLICPNCQIYLVDFQNVLVGAVLGRVGAEGGASSLANLAHFSPQIPDFSHLHQPGLESLSPNYSLQNSTFISQEFNTNPSKF